MESSENKFKTLWHLMKGHRQRYVLAIVSMISGVGLLYITPLITRAAIDGIITAHPASTISGLARFPLFAIAINGDQAPR